LAFGLIVIIFVFANGALDGGGDGGGANRLAVDGGRVVSEALALFYGTLLLLQGTIEMGIERRGGRGAGKEEVVVGGGDGDENDIIDRDDDDDGKIIGGGRVDEMAEFDDDLYHVRRMARTIIALTPATEFRYVVEDRGVLYSLGTTTDDDVEVGEVDDAEDEGRYATLALDALSGSRGGRRVALPVDHPTTLGLLPRYARRSALVQRVDDRRDGSSSRAFALIGSDRVLQAYTKNDLRWIGQLAEYGNLMTTMREEGGIYIPIRTEG
jgi:hypothetical protein